jgi:hypothetical protein
LTSSYNFSIFSFYPQQGIFMNKISLFFLVLSSLSFAVAEASAAEGKKNLNLSELSAKDTASFGTYSRRIALVQDSILATQKEIENTKKKTAKQMPALKPKDEYEKQTEFDARKAKWEKELDEKILRESKPLTDRLSELEKTKKQIEENQASLYCTLEIKTNPEAASIYLNKEEIGASPAEYNLALPGYAVIRIQKENYEPWDTTLTLRPAQKLKLSIALEEKSIFSKEGDINFSKITAKDTTMQGYNERINRVKARIAQIESEIRTIFADFPNTYPTLEPIKPDETLPDFERRRNSWQNEGERQAGALKYKYDAYKAKLMRSLETIKDNITATENQLITETRPNAQITLGNYDADKEIFEIEVQDTADAKSPFHFIGKVKVPTDTAKAMNRSTAGFLAGVSYLNYPFVSRDSSFNLAMKELSLSRKAIPLKVDGTFKHIGRFEVMEGYNQWSIHKDSLLSGTLKAEGLDLNYILKGEKPKMAATDATDAAGGTSTAGGGLGWRGWTRIFTFIPAVGLGTAAGIIHFNAEKNKKNENYRNILGASAGGLALVGIFTFVF